MRITVITRPEAQAQPWLDAFKAQKINVIHIPLLRIEPIPSNTALEKAWQQINEWAWVMFVSTNAVEHFFKNHQNNTWPAHLRVGAVGKGTAAALIKAGIPVELIDQPDHDDTKDSEHLWQHICQRNWQNAHVLIVRGSSETTWPERNWLIEQFQNAGAHPQALPVYCRCAPHWSDAQKTWLNSEQAQTACWLFTSSESFIHLPKKDWSKAIAMVTHPRIGEAAKLSGFTQVIFTEPELQIALKSVQYVIGSHRDLA